MEFQGQDLPINSTSYTSQNKTVHDNLQITEDKQYLCT